jgi:hypothetical protein
VKKTRYSKGKVPFIKDLAAMPIKCHLTQHQPKTAWGDRSDRSLALDKGKLS